MAELEALDEAGFDQFVTHALHEGGELKGAVRLRPSEHLLPEVVKEILRRQLHSIPLQHLVVAHLEVLHRFEFDFV